MAIINTLQDLLHTVATTDKEACITLYSHSQ